MGLQGDDSLLAVLVRRRGEAVGVSELEVHLLATLGSPDLLLQVRTDALLLCVYLRELLRLLSEIVLLAGVAEPSAVVGVASHAELCTRAHGYAGLGLLGFHSLDRELRQLLLILKI